MADPGKTILPFLSKLRLPAWGKKRRLPGPVTALDVDGAMLRVVLTNPRGNRLAVRRIAAEKLELSENADRADPAVLGPAIAKALERLGIKPGAVVMGVPRASVVLRTLTLPMLADARELASLVHFQIGKDLPFRLDEAIIDFKVRRQLAPAPAPRQETPDKPADAPSDTKADPAVPKLEVLVAAVKREVVEFYLKTAAAAGLKLVALGLLSHANARCLAACRIAEGNEVIALISLRPEEVGIDVVAEDALLFSRGAAINPRPEPAGPGNPIPEPAAGTEAGLPGDTPASPGEKPATFVEGVTIEVVRSLHSYGSLEPHSPVAKLVVVGATEQEPEVVEALQARLSMPCSWLDVASDLELPKAARENAAGSISAIGLALGVGDPGGLPFDFLTPKQPAVKRNLKRIRFFMATAAVLAVLVMILGVRSYLIRQRTNISLQVQAELKDAEKQRSLYRALLAQASGIKGWVQGSENWLQHYAYLTAILPPTEEIYLTSLTVSSQGTIRMAVQARSGEILAKLDKQLRAAGYDVKPIAITPGNDRFGYDFRTSVELIVPDKMKVDLTKVRPPARPADDGSLDPALYRKGASR